jgi:hypothetical protein
MVRSMMLAGTAFLLAPAALAAPADVEKCRAIADPAQRLACYDQATGQPSSAPAPIAQSPAAQSTVAQSPAAPPPGAASASPSEPRHARRDMRSHREQRAELASEGRIASVVPLPHGYFRLELADGTAYNTTEVANPPPAGAEVRIRRTFLGTTFFDIKGWSPIAVRLSREQ